MPVDWIKDDGTFTEDWMDKAKVPAELRDTAKDAKDVVTLVKRVVDTKREFHNRVVKIPEDPKEREQFLTEHFGKDLQVREETREANRKKAEEEAAAKLKTDQATAAVEAEKKRADTAEKGLREKHGANFDTNLELVRRAFRSDHAPEWIKVGVAKAAGVEPGKVTDDQIKAIVKADPAVFETLLTIATLTKDGHTEHGDGHKKEEPEVIPMQPKCPQLYKNRPDSDPEKQWFVKRGFDFATMTWNGQPV